MQDEERLLCCILTGHTHVLQSHVAITVICNDHVRSQPCQTSMRRLDPYLPTYFAGFVSRQSSVTCRHAFVFKMNTF